MDRRPLIAAILASLIAPLAAASEGAAVAGTKHQPQRIVIDDLSEVYGWYDDSSGILTSLSPNGFASSRMARRRLAFSGAMSDEELRTALNLHQDRLASYLAAYQAAEPRRQAERETREAAARKAEEERLQRDAQQLAESQKLQAEQERLQEKQAAQLERRQQMQIESQKAKTESERAQALKQLADAEMLRALAEQRAGRPPSDPPPGRRWQWTVTPEHPNGYWELVQIP